MSSGSSRTPLQCYPMSSADRRPCPICAIVFATLTTTFHGPLTPLVPVTPSIMVVHTGAMQSNCVLLHDQSRAIIMCPAFDTIAGSLQQYCCLCNVPGHQGDSVMSAGYNNLYGPIPSSWAGMAQLQDLQLGYNCRVCGPLPTFPMQVCALPCP